MHISYLYIFLLGKYYLVDVGYPLGMDICHLIRDKDTIFHIFDELVEKIT